MKTSKLFLAALASSIAVALPLSSLNAQSEGASSEAPAESSEITIVVTNADGTTTRRAATEGETVVAGAGETIALEFSDGSSVALAPNTSVSLSNISTSSTGDVQINIGYGSVSYNVPAPRTGKKIAISTPLGTAEVTEGQGEVSLDFQAGEVTLDVTNNTPGGGGVQMKSKTGTQTVATTDGSTKKNFDSTADESTDEVSEGQTLSVSATPNQFQVASNTTPEEFSTLVRGQNAPTPATPNNPLTNNDPVTTDEGDPLTGVQSPATGLEQGPV